MPFARRKRSWESVGGRPTDESAFVERRRFLAALGLGGLAASVTALGSRRWLEARLVHDVEDMPALDAPRSARWSDGGRALTPAREATRFPNFFEFGADKRAVPSRARDFVLDPWSLVVDGLVERPERWSLERVEALGLEERVYRHRCVEAWAMTVPWIGLPLAALLAAAAPLPSARYVALESFDPEAAGVSTPGGYPFPYREALRLDEAAHPLALLAVGLYGRRLTPQNGAPLRLVLPWKYGYKSAKSIVRLTLTEHEPSSFWHDVSPAEYGWLANVDPAVPHPRWSQSHERLLGSDERVPTRPFNGYDMGSLYA